jgi:hypothetical protein
MADLTEEQKEALRGSLSHLAFEFHHFRTYRRLLQSGLRHSHGPLCPAVRQAVIYALLLHFRLLIEFFYDPPSGSILRRDRSSASDSPMPRSPVRRRSINYSRSNFRGRLPRGKRSNANTG